MCLKVGKLFGLSYFLNMLIVGVYKEKFNYIITSRFISSFIFYCLQIWPFSAYFHNIAKVLVAHFISDFQTSHIVNECSLFAP